MSFSYKSPIKFDQNFLIRFLDGKFKNPANSCVKRFLSLLTVIFISRSISGSSGTKLKNGRVLVLCPVMSHAVVSCRVAYSLVHTCATRHDTTTCDTTRQRTKTRRFFSLVPHIPRHDHATIFRFITNSMTIS